MTWEIVAREVWEPPAPKRQKSGVTTFSARAEAALVRTATGWTVLYKTCAMSAVAFDPYTQLLDAWRAYRRHRDYVRLMAQPYSPPTRRELLERDLASLQAELDRLNEPPDVSTLGSQVSPKRRAKGS